MTVTFLSLIALCGFIFALGFSMGRSWLVLRIRREENRRRELVQAIMEKRSSVIKESKEISDNLEDLLYRVTVQQQITDLTSKKGES